MQSISSSTTTYYYTHRQHTHMAVVSGYHYYISFVDCRLYFVDKIVLLSIAVFHFCFTSSVLTFALWVILLQEGGVFPLED
jgi:hypothetical protein